ncbi:uncharacterized protein N7529_000003 [Penicillium soppii]|uniref:uncharacterized protein n=1 Tax=Penicillium soppii TaxID=69789 RepID=UPI002548D4DB|nr:uncharacterized protein N7529_000003 [Penicillium soppii]KAJ5881331.1 hypothetical protein N7529_000003 [Penicillium soppii]
MLANNTSHIRETYRNAGMTIGRAATAFSAPARRTFARNKGIPHHRSQTATAGSDPMEPIIGLGPIGLIPIGRHICTTLPTEALWDHHSDIVAGWGWLRSQTGPAKPGARRRNNILLGGRPAKKTTSLATANQNTHRVGA